MGRLFPVLANCQSKLAVLDFHSTPLCSISPTVIPNSNSQIAKIKMLAGFLFDLLPLELQELIIRFFKAVHQRIASYDAKMHDQPWYVILSRWGIAPSMVYLVELVLGGLALAKIYRTSRRLCFVLVGFAYPSICTAAALVSHEHDACHCWLTYWLIYSGFKGTDCCSKWIKPFFPSYPLLKLVVLCWAQHPITFGARMIYRACLLRLKEPSKSCSFTSTTHQLAFQPPTSASILCSPPTTPETNLFYPQASYIEENVWSSGLETNTSSVPSSDSPADSLTPYS